MPAIIHVIRHAQALHNVHQDFSLPDPELTELGHEQCKTAAAELRDLGDKTAVILASPLQRAIQTALAVFPAYTASGKKIVLVPDLQEIGVSPADTGNSREYLEDKFGAILDYDLLTPDWMVKRWKSRNAPEFVEERARDTRAFIRSMARKYGDEDVDIVVVTHGQYLWSLTKNDVFFRNVERRTYAFDPDQENSLEADLIETPESIARRSPP
ncbi:histidine phosphatase superfamily [Xylaria bambusicola]|uniref:histidine phosphatase superfamily n=1 Tax=Xylaria bambusicola TaxID=326684 RepID=UPI00200861D1|nr:histidine phosphatase superfamily [Xylaria bambusicola]KAI0528237.1 histidine phosphatase superfamily [Xylaria bambusicola]